jgi:phosphate transport system substrate-binding protein
VFDKPEAAFLHFRHFGVPGCGGRLDATLFPLILTALWLLGCTPQERPGPVEDSLTSGRIVVVTASEARSLMDRERAEFMRLYPESRIELRAASSREAIRALFAAECDLAVISRELEPAERGAASRGGLELIGYRFARDAVAMVVHPSNPVQNMALNEVRGIYEGRLTRWSEVGGRAAGVEPVVQEPEADLTEFFVQQVMSGEPIRARSVYGTSDSAVVAAVSRRPDALGYVSLAWADRGARALRLASLPGLPYRSPDLEAVYKGDYPLTRFLNLYARSNGPRLANGFITFVTSREGQKIVHDSGLVPTTVPVRFVRRSPMQGSH